MAWLKIEPLDVICARGNRLFGEPGSFGAAVMPPWPSVFAGALRSMILAAQGADPRDLLLGKVSGDLAEAIGNGVPTDRQLEGGTKEYAVRAGRFRVSWLSLQKDGEPVVPQPADLWGHPPIFLKLTELPSGVKASGALGNYLIKHAKVHSKHRGGRFLTLRGLCQYLQGKAPPESEVVSSSELWVSEERIGIGMNSDLRTVETGKLFTTEAIRLLKKTSFLLGVEGADAVLPSSGLLRLGGDGRGAHVESAVSCDPTEWVDIAQIQKSGRFRLILSTPGVFPGGWLPVGVDPKDHRLEWSLEGANMTAKLVSAVLGRFDVISGWDLAREQPKTAQRVVPAWSVYWFDEVGGAVEKVLKRVLRGGLWEVSRSLLEPPETEEALLWAERKAEGFNNVLIGVWPQ
ncbi:MAG: type III-B CRISPR module-associated Cmr3 family protein [Thermodesulfobacteriota bacterium]